MNRDEFPSDFSWGAATAAYQIEGAATEDGRGPSIWDTFSHTPGKVVGGDTGDLACDSYHRYAEDVALLAELGVPAYRFSVSWPRVQPTGRGRAEQRGLDYYRRVVDALLETGIEPWVTLYHWDLPQALEDAGGWPVRDTADRFVEYAGIVSQALGDRVRHWITLNEPWCAAMLGYASGVHAPGRREPAAAVAAVHHLLLGHGLSVPVIRSNVPRAAVGITLNLFDVDADSDSPADLDAARRLDGLQNRHYTEPVLRGRYPADLLTDLAALGPQQTLGLDGNGMDLNADLRVIATPVDFLGINYYRGFRVRARRPDEPVPHTTETGAYPTAEDVVVVDRGLPRTDLGWEVSGAGLHRLLVQVHEAYPEVPLVITENGSAWDDVVGSDGAVHDPQRVDYLLDHLAACRDAVSEGVPLRGYFAWSLLDNFEWAEGYAKRFGIIHVDFDSLQRTVKDSGRTYAAFLAGEGV
jgi:beta-glucosidase